MKTHPLFLFSLVLFAVFASSCTNDNKNIKISPKPESAIIETSIKPPDSLHIAAEYRHENLQIFVIEGNALIHDKAYVTLGKAMEMNYVVVEETGDVNQLALNNLSEHHIFIHSGDIVKGGRQDRTISHDVIISPNAKNVPLQSFCVEASRWSQRGNESAGQFSENKHIISSRKLKVASKANASQSEVWASVADQQDLINSNMVSYGYSADVTANASASSLELTLENESLDSIKSNYKEVLYSVMDKYPNAIGFAYAINGEVYGIEIYNNNKLFDDLWGKLLESTIVESVSEFKKDSEYANATSEDIYKLISKVVDGESDELKINTETMLHTWKLKDAMLFTTIDIELNTWVHKNYIAIDPTMNTHVDAD